MPTFLGAFAVGSGVLTISSYFVASLINGGWLPL